MKNLYTVKQAAEEIPGFTIGGLRNYLFLDTDGFRTKCAVKIGAKVLLDMDAVNEWVVEHREVA